MGKHSGDITTEAPPPYNDEPIKAHGPTTTPSEIGEEVPARAQWGNRAEFLLSCISLSVGLGNVWRFPYLAYANGGGAFLIPYLCVLFLVGKPMYFMEIALGQYHSQGPVKIWKKVVPLAKGIGAAQVMVCLFVGIFYVVIMSWTMMYFWTTLIAAFKGEDVPWKNFCDHEWAQKETCLPYSESTNPSSDVPVVTFETNVSTIVLVSASQQYFDRYILMRYDQNGSDPHGLETDNGMGTVNWPMFGCLAGSWVLVFLSLIKGVQSSGKVVYVTSTLPFIVLFILLVRGATLEGAVDGIEYFIIPKFDRLLNIQTWKAAAEQMFFSLSVAFGSLTMLGSYNRFNNNCYQDGVIVSVLDTLTSVTSGLAMFSVLGFLAWSRDVGVESVVSSGPGLAFVTFPEAMNTMPVAHLWAILFFVMLYMLGLGSEIGLLEMVFTFLADKFPALRTKKPLVAAIGCFMCFLVGIAFVTQGGTDLFDIFNDYAGGISVLFMATFEVICVMWVYGMKRFINNLKEMLGKGGDMSYYWRSAWSALSPVTLLFILVVSLVQYRTLEDSSIESKREPPLPSWADGIGWVLAGLAIIQLPVWAAIVIYKSKGNSLGEKIHQSLWPDYLMNQPHFVPEIQVVPTGSIPMGSIPRAKLTAGGTSASRSTDRTTGHVNKAFDKTE